MLYDKRWDKTKADPFKLGTLIAWLETQPANHKYEYCCNGSCLMAQYFTAMGFQNVTAFPNEIEYIRGSRIVRKRFPAEMEQVAILGRYTLGAALARAKALQP